MLSFFTAMRTHTGEKLAKQLVLAEFINLPYMVVMTKIIFTVMIVEYYFQPYFWYIFGQEKMLVHICADGNFKTYM